ncbi:hypothetical protein [Ruminococcus sp. HUN007]|uniref:hypothetical protein n=1 Tax=Ruminococcus sp. HUN007 TaxID=1514668 RepID=UPI0005D18C76|nr:hypothetical protein [Ruminococcus sp. HUN007]
MAKLVKYDVGTNFDNKLFDIIKECDKDHRIKNLYGKLKQDGLPGGRATSIIPELSDDQFVQYIKDCNSLGITFNYLINPLCMGQAEYDPVEGKNIRNTLHKLYDMGVRYFTINSPSLIKYVKSEFKDVQVTLGLYAYPVSIQQIEYWRNWGVDELTLDHAFNRNFENLRNVMKTYKDSDFGMRIIANNFCLKECPYRLSHGSFVGHSDPTAISMDFSLINCTYRKISNPKAMLTAEWVRPEDIHYYEELAEETGYKNFSIKLVDRTRATAFIERVIRAYLAESYDGNLLDIINWPETRNMFGVKGAPAGMPAGGPPAGMPPVGGPPAGMPPVGGPPAGMPPVGGPPAGMPPVGGPPAGAPKIRYMDKMNMTFAPIYGRVMNFPKIYIDNKKLDGFMDHFIKHNNCANSLCAGTIIEDGMKCDHACDRCGAWVDKVISYDKAEVEAWKQVAEQLLNGLPAGAQYEK